MNISHRYDKSPDGLLSRLSAAWRNLIYVLNICRFSIIMVLIGALLLSVSQGRDLLIAIAEGRLVWGGIWFLVAMHFWAVSAWYFARVLTQFRFDREPEELIGGSGWWSLSFMREHVPRALLIAAYAAVIVNLLDARSGAETQIEARLEDLAWIAGIIGVTAYLIALFAAVWVPWMRDVWTPKSRLMQAIQDALSVIPPRLDRRYGSWGELPLLTRSIVFLFAFVAIGLFFWTTLAPVSIGAFFDPVVLFFVWAGTTTGFGSLLIYWSNRSGFPVLVVLLAAAIVFSLFNDNHDVRSAAEPRPIDSRPTLAAAAKKWIEAHPARDAGTPVPVVIVATAGGGIRASYWMATVLGELDTIPGFSDHLFAISSVSGGSIGATVYRALLGELDGSGRLDCEIDGMHTDSVKLCAQAILKQDFLTPAIAAALYPDLAARFSPFGSPSGLALPDRQRALELGMVDAFEQVTGSRRLAESLLNLYPNQTAEGDHSWPALLLKATWVRTGQRIVASNLDLRQVTQDADGHLPELIGLFDQLDCLGRDIPLVTAAANSARFPGLSPAGTMRVPPDGHQCWKEAGLESDTFAPGALFGRLVDGGYFGNYGAVTARQVLEVFEDLARDAHVKIRPVVIQISSNPELPEDVTAVEHPDPIRLGYELRAPLVAASATRDGYGLLALEELRLASGGPPTGAAVDCARSHGVFLHFRMLQEKGVLDPPLGWALSEAARLRIESYLNADDLLTSDAMHTDATYEARMKKVPDELAVGSEEMLREIARDPMYKGNRENVEWIREILACQTGPR